MNLRNDWRTESSSLADIYYNKEETIENVIENFDFRRTYSAEGSSVTVDGITEQVIIQEHTNPLNADKTDRKIHVSNDSVTKMGSLVVFENKNWLVVSNIKNVDGAYKSAQILECNYTLKIQNTDGTILNIPCIFEQKSGYLDTNTNGMLTTVDGKSTIKCRFHSLLANILVSGKRLMIDSRVGIDIPNCYKISLVTLQSYDSTNGILNINLEKDEYNSTLDNKITGICDSKIVIPSTGTAKITFTNDAVIRVGGSPKSFTFTCTDTTIIPTWSYISSISGAETYFTKTLDSTGKIIKLICADESKLIGSTLTLTAIGGSYASTLVVSIKSL